MSGIIGYTGKRNIAKILLEGLRRFEYLGYDSAGIAAVDGKDLYLCRETGSLDNLAGVLSRYPVRGDTGIGQTRWATHGEPSRVNAHPHTDCGENIALVHNGIIENHAELKEKLLKAGHKFKSQTDSEVIAHLIEHYLRSGAAGLQQAVICALMDLKGAYAVIAISKNEPGKLVAARSGSPLLVGVGKNETFIASEAAAVIAYTREVIFLEDHQIVTAEKGSFAVTNLSGAAADYHVSVLDWDVEAAQKNGYAHFTLKEIHEQPRMVKKILAGKLDFKTLELNIEELGKIENKLNNVRQIIIQACGTSYHAGLIGKAIFGYFAGIHADAEISGEFRYRNFIAEPQSLVISISQSGETTDTLVGLRKAKQDGLSTVSLCNVVGSSIARESDAVFYIHAGPEIGASATKTFTAQLFSLYLIGIFLGALKKVINREVKDTLVKELTFMASLMRKVVELDGVISALAEKYRESENYLYLGRGVNYAAALEGALKLQEMACIHAGAYPEGEMKHGPIALVDENTVCVCLAPYAMSYDRMAGGIQEIKKKKGKVIAVVTEGNEEIGNYADDVLYIPKVQEIFSPLMTVLPLQLLAYHTAVRRGLNVDKAKITAKALTKSNLSAVDGPQSTVR